MFIIPIILFKFATSNINNSLKQWGQHDKYWHKVMKQKNSYEIYDSCGRATGITYQATNKTEAIKLWKADKKNYQQYCYGKLVRLYGSSQDIERASYK